MNMLRRYMYLLLTYSAASWGTMHIDSVGLRALSFATTTRQGRFNN